MKSIKLLILFQVVLFTSQAQTNKQGSDDGRYQATVSNGVYQGKYDAWIKIYDSTKPDRDPIVMFYDLLGIEKYSYLKFVNADQFLLIAGANRIVLYDIINNARVHEVGGFNGITSIAYLSKSRKIDVFQQSGITTVDLSKYIPETASNLVKSSQSTDENSKKLKDGTVEPIASENTLVLEESVGSIANKEVSSKESSARENSSQGGQDLIKFDGKGNWKEPSKWGFKDAKGKIIITPKYHEASLFKEGFAVVGLDNKYGYIDKTGKEVTPFKYTRAADFNEGVAIVCTCKNSGIGLPDESDRWGAIDKTGREVVPLKYARLGNFTKEGIAIARNLNGKFGLIDKTAKEITPFKYDFAGFTVNDPEGLARVSIGGMWQGSSYSNIRKGSTSLTRWGFVGKTGEITPLKYEEIGVFREGLVAVMLNGKYGFIDRTGKEVVILKYDKAETFYDGRAKVRLGNRSFYIDKNGNEGGTAD